MSTFVTPMPAATQRAHFDPKVGDSWTALRKVERMKPGPDRLRCVDVNFQLVAGTPVAMHWLTARRNGYTHLHDPRTGKTRPMSKAELDRPAASWGLAGVLSWRRRNGDRPLTYAEAVTWAAAHGVVICAELKSPGFADRRVTAGMVAAAKRADHPPWFMALLSMRDCRGKCAAIVEAGGQFAVIFGRFRNLTRRPPADWPWTPAPTRVWGPANTRLWIGRGAPSPAPRPPATPAPKPAPKPKPAPPKETTVNTPEEAIAAARRQSTKGPKFGVGLCLQRVRLCYGIAAHYPSAAKAWAGAKRKHTVSSAATIPRGVPVFWTGGAKGYGHIAIATGNGRCLSTDIRRHGYFDEVPIDEIGRRWGLRLVGWTEDLNGVTAWTPPPPARKPPRPVPVTPYDRLYDVVEDALAEYGPKVQKKYTARRRFIDAVVAAHKAAPVPASRKKAKK